MSSYAASLDTDPVRLAAVSERRAALTALTRKYGETIDEVLAWAEQGARRLLDLDGTDERIEQLRTRATELRVHPGHAGGGAQPAAGQGRDRARARSSRTS